MDLREQVRDVLGYSHEQMGNTQWIGHTLNRFPLLDRERRKAYSGGQMYTIHREKVLDMMERYDVRLMETDGSLEDETDHTDHHFRAERGRYGRLWSVFESMRFHFGWASKFEILGSVWHQKHNTPMPLC